MFPVSGSSYVYVPPSTGGGSTGGGTTTGTYPLTTLQWTTLNQTVTTLGADVTTLKQAQASNQVVHVATPSPGDPGTYDSPYPANALIIVNASQTWGLTGAARVWIDVPSTDTRQFSFSVMNASPSIPLYVTNANYTDQHFVNGTNGTYAYGTNSMLAIPPRGTHHFVRVNDANSGVTQLSGGAEEPGWAVPAIFQYPA